MEEKEKDIILLDNQEFPSPDPEGEPEAGCREPKGGWESYSLSVLSVFLDQC
jgi:hypothetical protein